MRFIPTRVHGILDYLVGVLLIFAPRIFGFENTGAASTVPVVLGVAALIYSLLTRYELGLIKVLPFKAHLAMDFASGVVLLVSPWAFGFSETVWVPHVIVGLLEIGAATMTRTVPGDVAPHVPAMR